MKYSKLVVLATLTMTAPIWAGVPIVVAPNPNPDNMLEWSQKINVSIEETNDNTATNLARAADDVSISASTLGGLYECIELYMYNESGEIIWSADNFHNYDIIVAGSATASINGTYVFSDFIDIGDDTSVIVTNQHGSVIRKVEDGVNKPWSIIPPTGFGEESLTTGAYPPTTGWHSVTLTYDNHYDTQAEWKYVEYDGVNSEWKDWDMLPYGGWFPIGGGHFYSNFRCIPSVMNASTANLFGIRVKNMNSIGYAHDKHGHLLVRISHPIPVR